MNWHAARATTAALVVFLSCTTPPWSAAKGPGPSLAPSLPQAQRGILAVVLSAGVLHTSTSASASASAPAKEAKPAAAPPPAASVRQEDPKAPVVMVRAPRRAAAYSG